MTTPRIPQAQGSTARRGAPSGSYDAIARKLVGAAGPVAESVARALREAHRAGYAEGSASPAPESEVALIEDVSAALAVGEDVAFRQPLGPCQGMPWHMEIGGRPVLAGEFAALVPDAAVRGLLARGALALAGDGTAVPGPRLPDLAAPPAPSR